MEELKPCPFCGEEVIIEAREYINYGKNETGYILTHDIYRDTGECPIAQLDGEPIGAVMFETESRAIKAWNTRV